MLCYILEDMSVIISCLSTASFILFTLCLFGKFLCIRPAVRIRISDMLRVSDTVFMGLLM